MGNDYIDPEENLLTWEPRKLPMVRHARPWWQVLALICIEAYKGPEFVRGDTKLSDAIWKTLGNGEITALPTYVPAFDAIVDAAPAIDRELTRLAAIEATEVKPSVPARDPQPAAGTGLTWNGDAWVPSPQRLPQGPGAKGQIVTTGRLVRPNDPGTRARVQREAQYVSDVERWERRNAAAERKAARKRRR